jgi:hypothetical protein
VRFGLPQEAYFRPIGIISILALTALTAGIPYWGSDRRDWPFYLILAGGLIFGIYLWRTPREKYSTNFAKVFGWLPVTLGAATYIYWYWYASFLGGGPETEFFHAAADVLPILLLATVVDVRRTKDLESKQLVLPIIAVFLGELAALNALAFGNVGPGDFAAVASSLVTSIVALILAVMADIAPSTGDEDKAWGEPPNPAQVAADSKGPDGDNPPRSILPRPPVAGGANASQTEDSRHTAGETQLPAS